MEQRNKHRRDACATGGQHLDALAQWALRFCPLVQVDPDCRPGQGGLMMDITGCQRLFHGEQNLLAQALQAAAQLQLHARAASAGTIGCAWAVARYGQSQLQVVEDGQESQVLAPLPASALRLEGSTVAGLAEVGLRRIGQILALPASALRDRYGPELPRRIDQALGRAWEVVEPVGPKTVPTAALELGGPIRDLQAIQLGVRHLLGRLLGRLGPRDLGVRRLQLRLKRSDAPGVELTLSLAHASRNEKHLWTLLAPRLEQVNMGFGVESLRLSAVGTAPVNQAQMALLPEVVEPDRAGPVNRRLGELVDVLSSRVGPDGVLSAQAVEAHVPERAFLFQRAVETPHAKPARGRAERAEAPAADRPSILLDRPEPVNVTALTPDGPIINFTWNGRCQAVRTCLGPERISPQWWQGAARADSGCRRGAEDTEMRKREEHLRLLLLCSQRPLRLCGEKRTAAARRRGPPFPESPAGANDPLSTRDYFKVQDDTGRWLWLYRQLRDNRCFVHGFWD